MITSLHQPVMLETALEALAITPDSWYIDATFGRGGHTKAILEKGGRVVAFDWDKEALLYGTEFFADALQTGDLILIHASFEQLQAEVDKIGHDQFSGILFDFGASTDQLKSPERGFSFEGDGELDMRMDTRLGVKAKDLLAALSEKQLTSVFRDFGGEYKAHAIAKAIVAVRSQSGTAPSTAAELVQLITRFYPHRTTHLHPATKVFQALRIAVNSELDAIKLALPQALEVLEDGGQIVTIAFHDGEDRIVKHLFKSWQDEQKGTILTKKPVTPSEAEVAQNPNARSAKLRIFKKGNRA